MTLRYRIQPYRKVPVVDRGSLLLVPLLARALVIYCAKVCDPEGIIPLRTGDPANALVFRFGGTHHDVAVVRRLLPLATDAACLTVAPKHLHVTDFSAWQRETREPWRRLYEREEGSFARLPFIARALAAYSVKIPDDEGRVVGTANRIAFAQHLLRVGGQSPDAKERDADRRVVYRAIHALFEEGFCNIENGATCLKNFVEAQRPRTALEPPRPLAEAVVERLSPPEAPAPPHRAALTPAPSALPSTTDASRTQDGPTTDVSRTQDGPTTDVSRTQDGRIDLVSAQNHSVSIPPIVNIVSSHKVPVSPSGGALPPGAGELPLAPEKFTLEIQEDPTKGSGRGKGGRGGKGRTPLAQRPDPPPPEGTLAYELWRLILEDAELAPIVAGPADFAMRLVRMFPEIPPEEMRRQMMKSGIYLASGQQTVTNGRRFLVNQYEQAARWVAGRARPAPPEVRMNIPPAVVRPTATNAVPTVQDPLRRRTA